MRGVHRRIPLEQAGVKCIDETAPELRLDVVARVAAASATPPCQ